MAAGLGFKDFTTGEVLTAADVDGYLMQGIWVFTNATARDAAVTSPQEGNFAFTKDNNSLWYYDGAAWVASGATGDIEGVTAGIGISGGGTSGTVTVTNSMATAIDAKGDLVVGTGADTFSKLTVGANGTTLVADSAETTGLKWATPAGGANFTLLNSGGTNLTGAATVTVSGISGANKILILVAGASSDTASSTIRVRFNTDTGNNYATNAIYNDIGSTYAVSNYSYINTQATDSFNIATIRNNAAGTMTGYLLADGCNSSGLKIATFAGSGGEGSATGGTQVVGGGWYSGASTISSISINSSSGDLDAGKVYVYTSA